MNYLSAKEKPVEKKCETQESEQMSRNKSIIKKIETHQTCNKPEEGKKSRIRFCKHCSKSVQYDLYVKEHGENCSQLWNPDNQGNLLKGIDIKMISPKKRLNVSGAIGSICSKCRSYTYFGNSTICKKCKRCPKDWFQFKCVALSARKHTHVPYFCSNCDEKSFDQAPSFETCRDINVSSEKSHHKLSTPKTKKPKITVLEGIPKNAKGQIKSE